VSARLRADALQTLAGWAAPSADQAVLRQRYVDYLTGHRSGVLRPDRPHHLTASTLVLTTDRSAVLLTLHAKARQWFQFGGHLEPDDSSLVDAATREATEESGLAGLVLDPVPVQLSDHEVPFCGEGVHHYDVRFVAVAPVDATHAVSAESLDVRWFPVDALPTDDPDMWELVDLSLRRLSVEGSSAAR
jgi:8-oxo-dGTP pyrophosphatase MutT (NUDIX family)